MPCYRKSWVSSADTYEPLEAQVVEVKRMLAALL
jgi:hypothetical protein